LRWVHSSGAGTEHLPLELLRSRQITITNGSGIGAIPIAEYVVLAMLAVSKDFPSLVRAQDRAEWLQPGPRGEELFASRALIVGYGAIGRAIGTRLRGFGVDVTGVRRRPDGEPSVIGLDEWRPRLGEFDWVILCAILTVQTRNLIGASELAAMKPTAWLMNISRGGLIDQPALIEALRRPSIGGAYLDVFEPEPLPADHDLWRLPNVILTPHSSWTSHRFQNRAADLFFENLERYLAGRPLRNMIDPEVGHRTT
jgi:phosphoglycerate dehydrogenase-like enzyme